MRQAEVLHVADEVLLEDALGEARVVELLLADAGGGEAAVVVAGKERALLRQREDLPAHRAEQLPRVALLEIGAAAAANEERVAGEGHRRVVEHVGHAAPGVARRRARFDTALAEVDPVEILDVEISALGAARRG